jgi:prophage DNA circulation protein
MAEELYDATLTYMDALGEEVEFYFDCQTLEDSFEKSVARHEFPFRDGALLEPMGQKARVIRVRCYFLNDNYENHKVLINYQAFADGTVWKFDHPEYGAIKGEIESIIVRHDEREQTAEIDLVFVENMRGIIDAEPVTDAEGESEEDFQTGQDELTDEFINDMAYEVGPYYSQSILDQVVDTSLGLFEQFSGYAKVVRDYVKTVDTYVTTLQGTLNAITNPASSLVSSMNYAANLPGYVIGSLAQAVERYAILYNTAESFPDRFVRNFNASIDVLVAASGTFGKYSRIAGAQRCAVELGAIFKADRIAGLAQKKEAAKPSFDAMGRYVGTPATERVLTVAELEEHLAEARTVIETAVGLARNMRSLQSMAQTLTNHVIETKKTRPSVVEIDVDNETPLHLVCLKYGLPYGQAEELMGMNRIRNPNITRGTVKIYGTE